ncbi:MAG TPA: PPC domain-containing DNA-binding protein [Longimicrobiaceae bacterium]|nr:PPC domain-containing DNA-binding protein [Longimicrobiaceae bacterium]
MQYRETPFGFFLVLDRGDEILESIARFATRASVRAAALSGIGTVDRLTLGFYDLAQRTYSFQSWEEEMALSSLTGNIAVVDGGPYPHLHGVFGRRDFGTLSGHLFGATVSLAVEITVVTAPEALHRHAVEFCDLKLIDL